MDALKTVVEDDEVIYTLGFYPDDRKMDGSYHSLSVKVRRKGLDVHYRQGYLSADTKVYTPGQRRDSMNDAVQNPLDSTELGLSASATAVSGRPGVYQLAVALNINEVHLEHQKTRWIGAIDFGTHFSNTPELKGTLETIGISLTEEQLRQSLTNGFVMVREYNTGGSTGVLRVVVQDRSTGSIGSVRVPLGTE